MNNVHTITHPLAQHKLSHMRQKSCSSRDFRRLMKEISLLLAFEVTRDLNTHEQKIETPLKKMNSPFLSDNQPCIISVLRAGNGILDGFIELLPDAKVGHIGLYRDSKNHNIIEYYFKVPNDISSHKVFIVDPILATGQTTDIAITRIKETCPKSINFVSILASKEGISYVQKKHPEVNFYTVAIDPYLDDNKYIIPGLGDAGDRLFGTI